GRNEADGGEGRPHRRNVSPREVPPQVNNRHAGDRRKSRGAKPPIGRAMSSHRGQYLGLGLADAVDPLCVGVVQGTIRTSCDVVRAAFLHYFFEDNAIEAYWGESHATKLCRILVAVEPVIGPFGYLVSGIEGGAGG